jgi:O-antigen ligase
MQSFKQLLTAISVFYIALAIKSEVKPLHLIRVIVISVAITALLALMESERTEGGRAVGLLTDPNYFALLLTFATPFAIYLLIHEKLLFFRVFGFISLAVILVAFEKTLSRSGLVVLVLVIAVLGIHYKAYLQKLNTAQISLIFGAVCLLGLTLVSLAPQEYRERIASLANLSSGVNTFEDRSLGRRSSYIIVAFDEFKKNPILGAGPGIFPLRYAQSGYAVAFSLNKNEPELFRRAHNTYLETVAETGILGLFTLCGVIWLGLRQIWLARRVHLRRGDLRQAAFAAHYFAAFSAIVLFFLFLTGINNKYFWICLALSGSFSHSITPSTSKIDG